MAATVNLVPPQRDDGGNSLPHLRQNCVSERSNGRAFRRLLTNALRHPIRLRPRLHAQLDELRVAGQLALPLGAVARRVRVVRGGAFAVGPVRRQWYGGGGRAAVGGLALGLPARDAP